MATAKSLIDSLADALGWTPATVEAYALELRRRGWWPPTKRGRGASPVDTMQAAKLLLSILSDGPKSLAANDDDPLAKFDGAGFFLRTANMNVMPADTGARTMKLRVVLGLGQEAGFLDYIAAVLDLFVKGKAGEVFASVGMGEFGREWDYQGPQIEFSVSGPFPTATIRFHFSDDIKDQLVAEGVHREDAMYATEVLFLHEMYRWSDEHPILGDDLIKGVVRHASLGRRTTIGFGGRELSACAAVLREDAMEADD